MIFTKSLILIVVLFSYQICFSQRAATTQFPATMNNQDSVHKVVQAGDDLNVEVRILPDKRIDVFKNDPELNYNNEVPEPDDWITKIRNWINQQLTALYSSKTYSTVLDYVYYGLMIAALILIVRGLFKADKRGLLFGKLKPESINLTEIEEDVNKMDFDELIVSAINNKNYKLAVRYLFLKSLQLLSEKRIIELRNNKTNYQYLFEIKNKNIADAFRNATLKFEWIWYGDFPVDENIMNTSHNEFNNLYGLITR